MSLQDMQANIDHVVHLMFENRGFDHLLGWLYDATTQPKVHVPALRPNEQEFYGVPHDAGLGPTFWLPDDKSFYGSGTYAGGKKFLHRGTWKHCYMPPADPGEPWDDVKEQIYGPDGDKSLPPEKLMRGFYLNYSRHKIGFFSNDDILATATPHELPVLNTLAGQFAVSDMWFCSVPTETNPNRAFSLGGSSLCRRDNLSFIGVPFTDLRTIFGVLGDTGHSWKIYADHKWTDGLYFTQYTFPKGMESGSFGSIDDFERDLNDGKLPVFSYIEPTFFSETISHFLGADYHPPGSLYEGEKFLARIYHALTGNKELFERTLFIVTFDEHGGTFDHVPPPTNAVDPTSMGIFSRYGVRVPTLLISPCVPAGCVFRAGYYPECGTPPPKPFDHTSVLATLMKWLNIPYTQPGDVGWLLARTAVAPTFEDAIGAPQNPNRPEVKPFDCHDFDLAAGRQRAIPDELVPQLVTRITDFQHGTLQHDALVEQVTGGTTDEEVAMRLYAIRERYGYRPRQAVRS